MAPGIPATTSRALKRVSRRRATAYRLGASRRRDYGSPGGACVQARSPAHVKMIQPELFGDLRAHHVLYVSLISAVTGARSPEAERRRLVELSRGYDDAFSEARRRGGWPV